MRIIKENIIPEFQNELAVLTGVLGITAGIYALERIVKRKMNRRDSVKTLSALGAAAVTKIF